MQEEVTQKTIALVFKSSRLTADVLKKAMKMYLEHRKAGKQATHGKMSVKDLVGQGMGASSIEVTDNNIKSFVFGRDTDKYALLHAEDSFVFLAYGCEVDEFQHIMYQNPDLTPDERNAEWLKLEKKYRPWIDFDNLPFYGRGAGWQRQLHIYECPFYYIDYCLSTMAALQFFLLSLTDHKDAWARYLRLVRRAGMASYTELLETAGLKVPFEEGSIKGIAQQMTDWLENHQV